MTELSLPSWAKQRAAETNKVSVVVEVDSEAAYADWLERLGSPPLDQYWIEVAYQCIKLDVQFALAGTEYDPRQAGKSAEFRFSNAPKYALANHPAGRGAEAATQGREARDHYVRLRGSMPF
jgi:hypothetical protein